MDDPGKNGSSLSPGTTAVSQEANRQYGPMKTKFWINLSECCSDWLLHNKSLNFAPWMVGLLLFGGTGPKTGIDRYCDAFDASILKKQLIAA